MATHIDLAERRAIERARKKGKGVNEIARLRRRSKSTISEEIRMGTKDGVYQAAYANEQAKKRRRQAKQKCLKVAMDPKLKAYVTQEITAEQTPEAISGRLKEYHTHLPYASLSAMIKLYHTKIFRRTDLRS
jgi:IS30 family transposase